MSFIWPVMLLTLLLIPILIGLYFRLLQRRRQTVSTLGTLGMVQSGLGRELERRRHIPPLFFLSGLALLLLGLARPEMIVSLPRTEGTVILAFDVSNSMLADDFEPTRFEVAKVAAQEFVKNQPRTIRIGVVAFGNGGLVVQPPTDDQTAILATIERLNPQGGTALGQGIFTALNAIAGEPIALGEIPDDAAALEDSIQSLQIEDYSSAVIVLLSDGENTAPPDPMVVAQVAAEAGVRIYPVGIGSPQGAVIDIEGFSIVTQLNEPVLQAIANLTNGAYYQAEDEESLQEIYETIDLQLTLGPDKMEVTALAASLSLLLFLVGGALSMFWFGRAP